MRHWRFSLFARISAALLGVALGLVAAAAPAQQNQAGSARSPATPQIVILPPPAMTAEPAASPASPEGGAVAPADRAARYAPLPPPADGLLRSAPPALDGRGTVISGATIR